jgi:S-adenosylmethionine:tRNA-ribosyltransferase-isomerase (queuine synthetase)
VPLNAAGLDRQNSRAIVAGRERTEMLRSVQSNLNDMLRSGQQIDINDLDGILGRLETLQDDDGTVGGLRVSVLRDNLNAANKMMGLVERINSAAQAGADQKTMQVYVDQLQALQQEMQTGSQDLIIPGATLPGVGDQ